MRLHLATLALLAHGAGQALAATEQPIYTFQGGASGALPQAGLIADKAGNLYGTTTGGAAGYGVVFKLSPPAQGSTQWTQTVLYAFTGGADGGVPQTRLTLGQKGVLYGTTTQGGPAGQGVVFSLSPPKKGAWIETVLYGFTGGADGGTPQSTLISDRQGNIYGTATQGGAAAAGVVFRLSPPVDGTTWLETVLYNFTGGADGGIPYGNLLLGSDGALYGTASADGQYGFGTIYRLVPANEFNWTFQTLYSFQGGADGSAPRDGMIAGPNGSYYGTTAGSALSQGTVFQLTAPVSGGNWTETPLYAFTGQGTGNGPWATVSSNKTGALYGTAVGAGPTPYGEIFELTQSNGKWTQTVLHAFQGGADGQYPYSTALLGPHGMLYGTAAGASGSAPGVVWQVNTAGKVRR